MRALQLPSDGPNVIHKNWGMEVVYANEPEYCAKLLIIRDGGKSSLHYHSVKKETFYVQSGIVRLERPPLDELLFPGDRRTLEPNTPHRFSSVRGAEILEVSTHHEDSDVTRIEPSGSL